MAEGAETDIVDSRVAQVLALIHRELGDDELVQLRSRVASSVKLGRDVRSVKLLNSDEPEIVFQPWRSSEGGR